MDMQIRSQSIMVPADASWCWRSQQKCRNSEAKSDSAVLGRGWPFPSTSKVLSLLYESLRGGDTFPSIDDAKNDDGGWGEGGFFQEREGSLSQAM